MTGREPRVVERHQLEGLDPDGRAFNRWVEITRTERGYGAECVYEGQRVTSRACFIIAAALQELVALLQERGFVRLQTRVNHRRARYLAEREPWVVYPERRSSYARNEDG